jgi:hypothetical protein
MQQCRLISTSMNSTMQGDTMNEKIGDNRDQIVKKDHSSKAESAGNEAIVKDHEGERAR